MKKKEECFADPLGNNVAAEDGASETHGAPEPMVNDVKQVFGDVFAVGAVEGGLVDVEHGLEDGVQGLVRDVQVEEEVDDPGGRGDAALVLEGVALQQGEDDGDGEDDFGHAEAAAEVADLFGDGFEGGYFASLGDFIVQGLEKVLPGDFDVGGVAVVGSIEDLETDVVVAGRVGVLVEQLGELAW